MCDDVVKEWKEYIELIPVLENKVESAKRILVAKQLEEDKKTDYNKLYGAKNDKVRKHHYNMVLSEDMAKVDELQQELDTANRMLSLTKFLAYMKLEKNVL